MVVLIDLLETNQCPLKNDIQEVFFRTLKSCNMQMKLSDPSQSFVLFYLHNMSNKEMEGK